MDRFDRFTDQARRVLTFAQGEAQRFDHHYIGTEHILLGLLRVEDGLAARVLRGMGVEAAQVRIAVEFIIGRGDRPGLEVGLTPRAKRVIELAIEEARGLRHGYIGTEHLLLGLILEGEGIAAGVLESLGIDFERTRLEVMATLGETPPEGVAEALSSPTTDLSGPVSIDEARHSLELAEAYWPVEASPLRRVVGIGVTTVDSGISVELVALELRAAGALLYWKAHPDRARTLGQPQVAVDDGLGTTYQFRHVGGSGSDRETKGEILLVPAPPEAAMELRITITRFAARRSPWQAKAVTGAWWFAIDLQ